MSMAIIISMATVSVAAFIVTASRIKGFQWLVKHATIVDIVFTIGGVILFAGTVTGMLIAVLSGLMMALFLTIVKKVQSLVPTKTVKEPIDDEHDADGNWIYNQPPYLYPGELQ